MTEFFNLSVPERGFEAPRCFPRGRKGKRGTGLLPQRIYNVGIERLELSRHYCH